MHRINRTRRNPAGARKAAAVVAVLLLIGLGLAACGSSGSSTTTSTSANAAATGGSSASTATVPSGATGTGPTGSGPSAGGPSGPTGARSGRFTALRECLQKNGVTLPKPNGQRRGFLGGATGLPNGVTRGQMEAALKKCGGLFGGGLRRFNNPGYRQSLAKFATCMRENGVDVPEPNTSGNGPVFNTKGLETNSAKFRTAEAKCRVVLRSSLRPGAGGAGSGPTG
jgi:hypothetical protein